MNLSFISWKVRFELSRLWMPIEPIVYDSKFNPGDVTDYYERYLVTHEIKGYRLWEIYYFVGDPLNIRKLDLFSDKLFAVEVAKKAANNKCFIGKQVKNLPDYPIYLSLMKQAILSNVIVCLCIVSITLLEKYYYTTALSVKPVIIHLGQLAVNKFIKNFSTEKQSYHWNLPLLLVNSTTALKNSCDRTTK